MSAAVPSLVSVPTLILAGGAVRTMQPEAPGAVHEAEAVAVAGRRVLAVGSTDEVMAMAGPGTEVMDLAGRLCLPGFFDSHFHVHDWTLGRASLLLAEAQSFGRCMDMIAHAARAKGPDDWVVGRGFNESDWPENRMPARADLDRAGGGRPVLVWRCDLHLAVASTRALEMAGLDASTPDPTDGVIERDPDGRPNGVLREGAVNAVRHAIPVPGQEELADMMAASQAELHRLGVTAVHDVRLAGTVTESALTLRAWQRLREDGRLRLRCWASLPGEIRVQAQALGLRTDLGDDYLRIGHLKYFMDGGMGARTAWLLSPYLDTGGTGLCLIPPEEMLREAAEAHKAGLAVMVHAIGDRAGREVIGVLEALAALPGPGPALPHRMEHGQMLRPEDMARLARLGAPLSAQPSNMVLDINMIDQCAGDMGRHAYAFRSMLDAGVRLMFSSDCPVCDPSPLLGIHGAVTRQRPDGTPAEGWRAEQRIGVKEAVRAFTATPAACYAAAHRLGSIGPSMLADLVVLDQDIFRIPPDGIARTRVDATVFDGRVVHLRT